MLSGGLLVAPSSAIADPPDTTGPTTQIYGAEDGATVDQGPTYALDSPDADWDHFECVVDDGTFTTCPGVYTVPVTDLGRHAFSARAVDTTGNTGATVTRTFTLVAPQDTTGPTVTITSGPVNGDPVDAKPTYEFSSINNDLDHFECAASADYDNLGTFTTCTSPHTVQGIEPGGKYAFGVRAVDTSGNVGPVARGSFLWTGAACNDATDALTDARADLAKTKTLVKKAEAQLKKAKKTGNPVKIKKAKKKLAAAKADQRDAGAAVTAAQDQVEQDC